MIDLDEIERRIPSRATECAYCYRLATLVCPVSGTMVCEDHRDLAAREAISTGCTDAAMVPARHDAATMDRGVMVRGGPYAVRWWALDPSERFCPRPVVTAVAATLDAGPRDADGREVTP